MLLFISFYITTSEDERGRGEGAAGGAARGAR